MKNQLLAPFLALLILCLPATQASAQTGVIDMVCFETNLGEFCVRLFPEDAPQTVANFLKYVSDGDYNNTIIHRNPFPYNFVIQGGGFSFDNSFGPVPVPKDPPVVNEFKRSNLRGTLAMAKAENDPNSATSEWFVNLSDNSSNLDNQNGGFTVFAEVVVGMNVVENIARQPAFDLRNVLGAAFQHTPLLNFDNNFVSTDFVTITRAYRTQRDPDAPTATDPFPNIVTTVNYNNAGAFLAPVHWTDGNLYRMFFLLKGTPPSYVFEVDLKTITLLTDRGQDRATFDGQILTIPSVKIPGGIITDVRFSLTNRNTLEFTLLGFNRYSGEGPL